eukprot:jgi/Bigna1/80158/fgenesh1_pg.68_\
MALNEKKLEKERTLAEHINLGFYLNAKLIVTCRGGRSSEDYDRHQQTAVRGLNTISSFSKTEGKSFHTIQSISRVCVYPVSFSSLIWELMLKAKVLTEADKIQNYTLIDAYLETSRRRIAAALPQQLQEKFDVKAEFHSFLQIMSEAAITELSLFPRFFHTELAIERDVYVPLKHKDHKWLGLEDELRGFCSREFDKKRAEAGFMCGDPEAE